MKTIVCIEDEDLFRRDIVDELSEAGYLVLEAAAGDEGLALILDRKPDLVVSDVFMPGMSGLNIVMEIREKHQDFHFLPFIFVSAIRNQIIMKKIATYGLIEYMPKPVDFDELLKRVDYWIKYREEIEESVQKAEGYSGDEILKEAEERRQEQRRNFNNELVEEDQRSILDRRSGEDRRGHAAEIKINVFNKVIMKWLEQNCLDTYSISHNPRDKNDRQLRIKFDNPEDKAAFAHFIKLLKSRSQSE